MSPKNARIAGALFAISTAALLALVLLHAHVLSSAVQEPPDQRGFYPMRNGGVSAGFGGRADYVVSVYSIPVVPGDVVTIPPFTVNNGKDVVLYVVEGGQSEALVRDQTPEHVYVEERSPAKGAKLVRPQPPAGTRPTPLPGVEGYVLDIVWVGRGEATGITMRTWNDQLGGMGNAGAAHPTVVRPYAFTLEPWWTAAQWALAISAAGSGAAWLLLSRRERAPAAGASDTEALARLADSAGEYLLRLRSVLRMGGFLLLLGFVPVVSSVVSIFRGHGLFLWYDLGVTAVVGWLCVAYAGVVLLWLRHYLLLRRELARWRQATRTRPLGL